MANFYELAERDAVDFNVQGDQALDAGNKLVTIFNIKKKEGGGLELGKMRAVIAKNSQINKPELAPMGTPQELAVNLMNANAKGKLVGADNIITGEAIGGALAEGDRGEANVPPDAVVEFNTANMVDGDGGAKIFTATEDTIRYASNASRDDAVAAARARAEVPADVDEAAARNAAEVNVTFVTGEKGTIKKNGAQFEIYKNNEDGAINATQLTVVNVDELNGILGGKVTIDNDDPANVNIKRIFRGGRRARSKSAKRKSKRGGRRRKRKSAKRKH